MNEFKEMRTLKYWVQMTLPLVYEDSLSYMELLSKVVKLLNELIINNNNMPKYIQDLIREYINSGEIGKVVREILADFMLNVKNPPNNATPASGDGSTDDTEAIQACIDFAYENGGKAVYFPSGVYLTKSLELKNGVSLFGFDPNTTRLVLRGGATKPLLSGTTTSNTIKGLSFDGNSDIQVENLNLIALKGGKYIFNDLILTDGYDLLNLVINDNCFITNTRFDKAVKNGLVIGGNGQLVADNIIVNHLSAILGESAITLNADNCIINNLFSKAIVYTPIIINSSYCSVSGKVLNYTNPYIDNGEGNNLDLYGVTSIEKMNGSKRLVSRDFIIDIFNPITYRKPDNLNDFFKTIPFKDKDDVEYSVLVKGDIDLQQYLSELEDTFENENNRLEEIINKKANIFLSNIEPITDVDNNSLWFEIDGIVSCVGDGVAIGNAETSDTEPFEAPYWFDPIDESED